MDRIVEDGSSRSVLDRLDSVVDELFTLPLDSCTDDDVLVIWQRLETVIRRLASVDHALVGQVRDRHLDFVHGCSSVTVLARQVLRIGIREAKARVSGAEAAGPRRSLTGEVLAPVFEQVAAAQGEGSISPAHARVIVRTIDRLPDPVQASDGAAAAEVLLVEHARAFDPDALAVIAQRLCDTLDPDGRLPDYEQQQQRRFLRLTRRDDGSGRLEGELSAEATEQLRTALDALGKPLPAEAEIPDRRSPGQRDHDALLDLVKLVERAELLPHAGGVTTTLILTCDTDDWANGTGQARTGHGSLVPTREAWRWVSGDTRTLRVALDRTNAIRSYTDTRRIFTENQRLAMIARDQGCAFPGCDAPPHYTQAHHLTDHADGGRTSVDNGCLLCSFHHREFGRMGWTSTSINGIPHFIPPHWHDPERQPRRNTAHNPARELAPV